MGKWHAEILGDTDFDFENFDVFLFFWIPDFRENGCSPLRKAEELMPRDIMSSEPRHWMVFGQLVMPVQCCAGAPAAAVLQHSTAQV